MEVEALKREFRDAGLTGAEVQRCLKVLRRLYIGQHIRINEGVLRRDFNEFEDEISRIIDHDLVLKNKWYSHLLFQTTESGSSIGEKLVEERLSNRGSDIREGFQYAGKIVPFLVFNYLSRGLAFPKHGGKTFDWMEPLLEDERVWSARNELFQSLLDLGLCVETHAYVSTRGGELREENYVISPEVRDYLQSDQLWGAYKGGLTEQEKKQCEMYRFLLRAQDFLDVREPDKSRDELWDRMKQIGLSEENVEDTINKLNEDGATTRYRGLLADELPFEILSESRYQVALQNRLINPILADMFEDSGATAKEDRMVKELREGKFSDQEIDALKILAGMDHSVFANTEDKIRGQLEKAVELYCDEHWSDCLARINNVCENLVYEIYLQRGEEIKGEVERLLNSSHGQRLNTLQGAPFVTKANSFRSLPYDLKSIHWDRNRSSAAHGGESIVVNEGDVRRNVHILAKVYFDIEKLLR